MHRRSSRQGALSEKALVNQGKSTAKQPKEAKTKRGKSSSEKPQDNGESESQAGMNDDGNPRRVSRRLEKLAEMHATAMEGLKLKHTQEEATSATKHAQEEATTAAKHAREEAASAKKHGQQVAALRRKLLASESRTRTANDNKRKLDVEKRTLRTQQTKLQKKNSELQEEITELGFAQKRNTLEQAMEKSKVDGDVTSNKPNISHISTAELQADIRLAMSDGVDQLKKLHEENQLKNISKQIAKIEEKSLTADMKGMVEVMLPLIQAFYPKIEKQDPVQLMKRDKPTPAEEAKEAEELGSPVKRCITLWDVDKTVTYMEKRGFKQYSKIFKEMEMDGYMLLTITEEHLAAFNLQPMHLTKFISLQHQWNKTGFMDSHRI